MGVCLTGPLAPAATGGIGGGGIGVFRNGGVKCC